MIFFRCERLDNCSNNSTSMLDITSFGTIEETWQNLLKNTIVKRNDINLLIMDYLKSEGFKDAAEKFEKEAFPEQEGEIGFRKSETSEQIDKRIAVRAAIVNGDIEKSIQLINDFYPVLIDNNRDIYFKLQQQQLIELIRNQKYEEAIRFAQDQINGDQSDGVQIEELEKTLALLAFENPEKSPYSDLMQPAHRNQLATRINEAILKDQFGDDEAHTPKLVSVIKLFLSTQNELDNKKIPYQKIVDPFTCKFETKH